MRNGSSVMMSRSRANRSGRTMMLATPVSSSRVRNTKPFAVPGRWRVMTMPDRSQIAGAHHAAGRQFVAPQRHRVAPDRQPRSRVIRDDTLGLIHGFERARLAARGSRLAARGLLLATRGSLLATRGSLLA